MLIHGWGVQWSSDHNGKYPPAWYVYAKNGYKLNPIGGPGFFGDADPFVALAKAWEYEESCHENH